MINATEARLRSDNEKEIIKEKQLKNIQNKIEEAISEGKCYCYYYGKMHLDIKQQLENLGYHVEICTQYKSIWNTLFSLV